MRGGMCGISVSLLPWDGRVDLSLLVSPALTFPQAKQNVRLEHFSSLGTWGVFWVLIHSMSSTLPGSCVNEGIP